MNREEVVGGASLRFGAFLRAHHAVRAMNGSLKLAPGVHVAAQQLSASGVDEINHGHEKASNPRTAGSTRLSLASSKASHW